MHQRLSDADARTVHVNPAAQRILDKSDGLTVGRGGVLHATLRNEGSRLKALIRTAADVALRSNRLMAVPHGPMPNGGSMRVSRPFAMGALEVLVTPLRTENFKVSPALSGRASVMIVLVDPDQAIEMHASELRQLYGFTAAEARLALQLVMGKDLPAAALAMEVSIHTVRTLLKRAFERTGTHRQADFVAKMLSGPLGLFRIPR